jgi:DNA-binding NarL/FixJ family response regulator
MTPAERVALERKRSSKPSGWQRPPRAPDRESPADHGAFLSRMDFGNTRSDGLPVALCASDPTSSEQVAALLGAAGHTVLARSASGDGLLASCIGNVPACVVIAADRPDRSTVDIVRLVRSTLEDLPAVLVCRRAAVAEVRRALELGVDGIVLQEDLEEALGAVVEAVCAGQVSAPNEQRRALRARALTTREKQVLMLVAAGLTNSQIAAELFLAESTVKSHLSSAFGKLGVSSRSEAAAVILDPERGRGLGIGRVAPAFAASR